MEPFQSTGPHGHRSRMRTRLLAAEGALADYEILEMLLFLGIPRRDTKPLAKALINRFGSLAGALTAPSFDLGDAGLPPRAIEALGFVGEAAAELERPERRDRITLGSWDALDRHLACRRDTPAGTCALLLDSRNRLVAEPRWEPGADPAQLAREMLRHALDRHASAAILVRHCIGRPQACEVDHDLLDAAQAAAAALSVVVHDLVVAGDGAWVSLLQPGAR